VITQGVMNILKSYNWPGNIRELKNVLERALMLTPRGAILREAHFTNLVNSRHPLNEQTPRTVQEVEERHIKSVLKQMGGDIDKTAKSLNISRATLYRRLKRINLDHG